MELIKKKISLDSIKTFSNNKISSYFDRYFLYSDNEYNSWGKIPMDFIFITKNGNKVPYGFMLNDGTDYSKLLDLFDTLPFTEGNVYVSSDSGDTYGQTVVGKGVILRYKTLENNFNFLTNFIKELKFYRLCERKNTHKWVELVNGRDFDDIFEFYFSVSNNITLIDSLPSVDSVNYCNSAQFQAIKKHTDDLENGAMYAIVDKKNKFYNEKFKSWNGREWTDIICVGKNHDDIMKKFWVNGKSYEKMFYNFSMYMFNKVLPEPTIDRIMSVPYIDIPLCLTQTSDSIGRFKPYVEEWVANKKYYIGDNVIYKSNSDKIGSVYVLKKAELSENVEITESVFNSLLNSPSPDSSEIFIENDENGLPHFYKKVYYYTGTYDILTKTTKFDSSEGEHWVLSNMHDTDASGLTLTESIGESRIKELERYKKSFDDNGNLLPFVTIKDTSDTEIKYLLGNTKMKYNESGFFYCNVLNSITFMDSERPLNGLSKEIVKIEDEPDNVDTFDENAECYVSTDGLELFFGKKYTDGKKHFFSISNELLNKADTIKSITINFNGAIKTIERDEISDLITYDALKYGDNSCFSLIFNENGELKKVGIGFKFSYGVDNIPELYDICMGNKAISLSDSGITKMVINSNDVIIFDYAIDKLLEVTDEGKIYDNKSGVNFIECHKYNVDECFCNYDGNHCWLEVNLYDHPNTSVVDISEIPKLSQASSNVIYHYTGETIRKNTVDGKDTINVYEKGKYYIKTSLFNYINIDYDKAYKYDENNGFSEIGRGTAVTYFNSNQLISEFQDVNGFFDESALGIQDITTDVDAYIDRSNNNTASLERLNILGEINTFADLVNYKNNYFNL